MPLTDRQKNQLYEIYEVSHTQITTVTSGSGYASTSTLFDVFKGVKQQLQDAILTIDADAGQVARVGEILSEFDNWALDPSTIDREGYSLKPSRNYKRVRMLLYSYTGILFRNSSGSHSILRG
jgi:hypothetical protein